MKTLLWVAVLYQTAVGLAELTWVSLDNPALAALASLPSAASVLEKVVPDIGTSGGANYIEGTLDVAIGAGVWWFVLR